MGSNGRKTTIRTLGLVIILATTVACEAAARPLKVFILAGQSNMEGPASVGTFDYIGDDPATAPMLQEMVGPDGKAVVCDHAYLSYLTGDANFEVTGKMTAGYGSMWGLDPKKPGNKIGPEFTFGLYLSKAIKEPFLIIKTAWGGKSLHTDFRPPGAGPYVWSDFEVARLKERGDDLDKAKADKAAATGVYYRLMVEHVKKVLADIARVVPEYDANQGYELAGFVWFQGWNDLVSNWTYDKSNDPDRYALYGDLLTQFIRDVRKDLAAPRLPFVIGVVGFEGVQAPPHIQALRKAQVAPTLLPEFQGNVLAVQTAPFWASELAAIASKHDQVRRQRWGLESKHKDYANAAGQMTKEQIEAHLTKFEADLITPAEAALWRRGASNAGYHYFGCAKTFALMGKAFAEAALTTMRSD